MAPVPRHGVAPVPRRSVAPVPRYSVAPVPRHGEAPAIPSRAALHRRRPPRRRPTRPCDRLAWTKDRRPRIRQAEWPYRRRTHESLDSNPPRITGLRRRAASHAWTNKTRPCCLEPNSRRSDLPKAPRPPQALQALQALQAPQAPQAPETRTLRHRMTTSAALCGASLSLGATRSRAPRRNRTRTRANPITKANASSMEATRARPIGEPCEQTQRASCSRYRIKPRQAQCVRSLRPRSPKPSPSQRRSMRVAKGRSWVTRNEAHQAFCPHPGDACPARPRSNRWPRGRSQPDPRKARRGLPRSILKRAYHVSQTRARLNARRMHSPRRGHSMLAPRGHRSPCHRTKAARPRAHHLPSSRAPGSRSPHGPSTFLPGPASPARHRRPLLAKRRRHPTTRPRKRRVFRSSACRKALPTCSPHHVRLTRREASRFTTRRPQPRTRHRRSRLPAFREGPSSRHHPPRCARPR